MPSSPKTELVLATPAPFELGLALFGHGFVDLAPNHWHSERRELSTAVDLGGRAADVVVRQRGRRLELGMGGARSARERERVRGAIAHMLRLDDDLRPFWRLCAGEPRLSWVARRGGGRLTRSPTLFEDLAKLLMTTNCSWAATRNMVARLVGALGSQSPSGRRAFPSAEACAARSEAFFRDTGRLGYRAGALRKLAKAFATGELRPSDFQDPALSTDEVRERLLALPGFGPYAAGQALRLLGRYDDFALDSWCRARLAQQAKSGRAPSERTLTRSYARYGSWRGLALWMDLTAHWHGEAPKRPDVLSTEP